MRLFLLLFALQLARLFDQNNGNVQHEWQQVSDAHKISLRCNTWGRKLMKLLLERNHHERFAERVPAVNVGR